MINRTKNTVLLLKDTYPGCNDTECDFITKAVTEAGFYVRPVTVKEFYTIKNIYNHHAFLLIVPSCQYLPIETVDALRRYNNSAGSVLFLGGPLYYHRVECREEGFEEIPLEKTLDANFTLPVPYVREGIAPSYKTYASKGITKATPSAGQNIFDGRLTLPHPIDVTIPCETGVASGYITDSQNRFIPVADCFDENSQSDDILLQGRCDGRRGSFAFIELQRTMGDGYEGINDYGMVNTTAIGSVAASIGAECPMNQIGGADQLIAAIVKRISIGLYLFEGGLDGLCYRKGERITAGAQVLNNTERFETATVEITVMCEGKPQKFEKTHLLPPKCISDISFEVPSSILDDLTEEKDYAVKVQLIYKDNTIDEINSTYCMEAPVPVDDPSQFVAVKDDYFTIDGKPWYMAGINYWSTWNPALEKRFYWLGQFDRSNYSPSNVENDLKYIEKIGLNCLLIRFDFAVIERIIHPLRDFLIRCKRHNIRVSLAFVKATSSKFYCPEAVDYIFERVFISCNPTVMAIDMEWETQDQHHLIASTREEFNDEWQAWLINKYGTVEAAEEYYGYKLPRDCYGYVSYPAFDKKIAPDIYRFAVDCIDSYWEKLMKHLKPLIPHQLTTFRQGGYCTAGFAQAAKYIDYTPLEIYGFGGYEKMLDDPIGHAKAMGLCVSGSMAQKYETGGKPVVWAEYGYSVCGAKQLPDGIKYDHKNRCYFERDIKHQADYNRTMSEIIEDAHCAGSAPWWWCGGFRYTELADYGYMMPNGLLSQSGREYVGFCEKMKAKAGVPDTREAYICEGNIFDYVNGKREFIRTRCLDEYCKAREQGKRFVVITHYDAEN